MGAVNDVVAEAMAAGSGAPLWPYIVGGVTAIVLTAIGAVRLVNEWRKDLKDEAQRKALNTEALDNNTRTAKQNTEAIQELTHNLNQFVEETRNRLIDLEWRTGIRGAGGRNHTEL